jgi:hypothetical protein
MPRQATSQHQTRVNVNYDTFAHIESLRVRERAGGPVGLCPTDNDPRGPPTFLLDAKDCSFFYICDWGVAKLWVCTDPQVFIPLSL